MLFELNIPPSIAIFVLLALGLIAWTYRMLKQQRSFHLNNDSSRRFRQWLHSEPNPISNKDEILENLESCLQYLSGISWLKCDTEQTLSFTSNEIKYSADYSLLLKLILAHIKLVAPKLEIPSFIPKVKFDKLKDCAGSFTEDSEGWVTICIENDYLLNPSAAKSIMCHEACHYILNYNGIRKSTTIDNEYLTETAMFVFGLGEFYLTGNEFVDSDGMKRQLGYLQPEEYLFLQKRVNQLWRMLEVQDHEDNTIETLFRAIFPNANIRKRLLEAENNKHPSRSRSLQIQAIIERHKRDRN
ncbi:hypothetical protein KIH24_01130 [Rhizobiales bacterium TNE-4]|nr:hypothetical protein [Rhizobiales bacterium TNE-4]MBV1826219.1 hypothetical protein [Rhizobiales bacterium TNE-4]